MKKYDLVNRPKHYDIFKKFDSIEVSEVFNFCLGNALKYILRCNFKGNKKQDLKKAIWYLNREIKNIK